MPTDDTWAWEKLRNSSFCKSSMNCFYLSFELMQAVQVQVAVVYSDEAAVLPGTCMYSVLCNGKALRV